jgi:putative ABC transport system permease protein
VPQLQAIPGIARLETRPTGDVVVRVPGLAEPATGHFIGIGESTAWSLNRIVLRSGRLPEPDERDVVAISEGFAEANALGVGDTLGAVISGRWRVLRVVGVGIVAEFIYELRPGDMLPDSRRYGVMWIGRKAAEETFDLESSWNELAATLTPGANELEVIAALDNALERYGSLGAYGRNQHASHQFLDNEIRETRTYALMLPAIFLGVAAFLINLVLGRVVAQQRDQIGTLKAFGLPLRYLVRHYVLFALTPTLVGSVLGIVLGLWIADYFSGIYQAFFRFPELGVRIYPMLMIAATGIGMVASIIGALGALRRVFRLAPAQSMNPEPPAVYAAGIVERLLGRHGSPVVRMIARSVTHRPWRTALGALGVGLGSSVIVLGSFGFDAVDRMRSVLFERAMSADVSVVFAQARGPEVRVDLLSLPGVREVELGRDAPVRISKGHRSRRTALIGVENDARLRRVVGTDGRPVRIPPSGISLSAALARILRVKPGDTVDVTFLDGRGRRVSLPVASMVDDLSGTAGYVTADRMAEMAGAGEAVTSAELAVDDGALPALYAKLTEAPAVQSVLARARLVESFDETIRANFAVTLGVLIVIATALAMGTIYNAGRVTLSERARDLASLRVLGFTRGEAARILFGELAVLAVLGLPVGIAIGAGFAWLTVYSFGSDELFRLPFVIGPRAYLAGMIIPVLAGLLSLWPLTRRVNRLNLIESLKTRE